MWWNSIEKWKFRFDAPVWFFSKMCYEHQNSKINLHFFIKLHLIVSCSVFTYMLGYCDVNTIKLFFHPHLHSNLTSWGIWAETVSSFHRVIKPEEGKKLADTMGAAFMESSAKENEVWEIPFWTRPIFTVHWFYFLFFNFPDCDTLTIQTAVEVFKRIILEMEKADGNAPPEEKKCVVMWEHTQDII